MLIRELLVELLPMKDIKQRIANHQIKINNLSIGLADLNKEINVQDGYWELGVFLYLNNPKTRANFLSLIGANVRDFFGDEEDTNIKELEFLTGYTLITLAKRDEYVFIIK